jgi:hypothetical protein
MMNNFTPRAQQVLALARKEAASGFGSGAIVSMASAQIFTAVCQQTAFLPTILGSTKSQTIGTAWRSKSWIDCCPLGFQRQNELLKSAQRSRESARKVVTALA